ncbi:MAG: glycosyltransferase family 4 protein [candidate division Zixibacteria bacterium]
MRIRFVTLYFPPEMGAAQRRISEMARRLANKGHKVTVVTGFPNYPTGLKPKEYHRKFFMREKVNGYGIIRLYHYTAPNKGFLKRIMIHLTFALSASIYNIFMKRDDIVYIESPPLFNGFIGLSSKLFRRIPYLFNVADLWPQTAIELKALRNKQIIFLARLLERVFYAQSSGIIANTKGARKFIMDLGFDDKKALFITNGVDLQEFHDQVVPSTKILKYKKEGRLLAIYAGILGMAQGLKIILEAAKELEREPIDFLFVGDGHDKEMMLEYSKQQGLKNVTFLDPVPQQEMPSVLKAADIAIISLRNLKLFNFVIPSKCFESMASELPIMLSVPGEMAEYVNAASCGFTAEPENLEQIVGAFRKFIALPDEERIEMGRRGRTYAIRHFSREDITNKLESAMRNVLSHGK